MPARSPKIAGEKPKNRRGPTKAEIARTEEELFQFSVSAACIENLMAMAHDTTFRLERLARSKTLRQEIARLRHITLTLMTRQGLKNRRGFC